MGDRDDCINILLKQLEGELIVGNHDTISMLGGNEQQRLNMITKDITNLVVWNETDIESLIESIIGEIENIDVSIDNKSRKFVRKNFLSKSVLVGRLTCTMKYLDKLFDSLQLQKAHILKEEKLLIFMKDQIEECIINLKKSISKGKDFLCEDREHTKESDENYQWILRLKLRVEELEVTYTIAIQTVSQLEVLIYNNKLYQDKISKLTQTAIPVWKEQVENMVSVAKSLEAESSIREIEKQLEEISGIECADKSVRKKLQVILARKGE